jgi:hypothetical protein
MDDDRRGFDPMASTVGDADDRMGFEDTTDYVGKLAGGLVPQALARRAVDANIATDRDSYAAGDPVDVAIEFRNRLPVPVSITTPGRRAWTWTFDGHPEASRERRYLGEATNELTFDSRERKRIVRQWNGLVKQADGRRWVEPSAGEHELAAYVALEGPPRPEARTTIRIE